MTATIRARPIATTDGPIPVGIGLIRRGDAFLIRRRRPGRSTPATGNSPAASASRARIPPGPPPANVSRRSGCASSSGALRRVTTYRYPHGFVELFFHDCHTLDLASEPVAGSGFRWVEAADLAGLRFPEANEPLIEELVRQTH